jgi:hypothetical protein
MIQPGMQIDDGDALSPDPRDRTLTGNPGLLRPVANAITAQRSQDHKNF